MICLAVLSSILFSKTYTSKQDFKIIISKQWRITDNQPHVLCAVSKNEKARICVKVRPKHFKGSFEDFIKNYTEKMKKENFASVSYKKTVVNDVYAYELTSERKVKGNLLRFEDYLIYKNNKVYSITYTVNEGKYHQYKPDFEEMLNSFRFKNPD